MGLDRTLKRTFPAVVLALLGVAAYFQASGLGQILASAGVETSSLPPPAAPARHAPSALLAGASRSTSGDAILDRNPFDSITGPLRGEKPAPPTDEGPADDGDVPTCDAARVVLITWSEEPEWSFASIAPATGKSQLRRAGDEVGDYKVERIDWDRVWLSGAAGRRCQMEVGGKLAVATGRPPGDKPPPPPLPPGGRVPPEIASKVHVIDSGHVTIERSVVPLLMEQQAVLFRSVRATPEKDGGLRVAGVRTGSLLEMVGVKNGDRLMNVNGMSIADPTTALKAYTLFREASHLTVALQRDGKPMNVEVDIR